MTRLPALSTRHATGLCVWLVLALVPTIIHSYVGVTVDDGVRIAAIPRTLAGYSFSRDGRPAEWFTKHFDSIDSFDGRYSRGNTDVTLTAIRSYELTALYHHPELAVAYGTEFTRFETRILASAPGIPVHVLRGENDNGPVAMYVLFYDGRYVAEPIRFQLRIAGELLFSGRKPMTLIFARADRLDAADLETSAVARVLLEAARSASGQSRAEK